MTLKNKITDKCCEKCWHSAAKPCPDYVECIKEGPLCHESRECSEKKAAAWRETRLEGKERRVCFIGAGTCGLGAGASKVKHTVERYISSRDLDLEVVETGCVGLCSAEPIIDIKLPGVQRISFRNVEPDDVPGIISGVLSGDTEGISERILGQYREPGCKEWESLQYIDEHPFFRPQKRLVLKNCGIIDPSSIESYIAAGGYKALSDVLKGKTPEEVCSGIEKSGLRGRGGGGFPAGRKWDMARKMVSDYKYFVCNADEGDPGAFMDRAVIEGDPHRLIEGLTIASYAIGAGKAYVYIRAEYPLAIERLKKAISDAKECGLLGHNILDSGFNLEIVIKKGAGAFVCGEETALLHSIEGKRGMPRPRPPYPAASGLFEKPTIINNVETLANVSGILSMGVEEFAETGTENSKGTKVFALSGKVTRTGLIEIEMGKHLSEIINEIGGGIPEGKEMKAVQIGGPSGGCIPLSHIDITIDYESLKSVGAMMGSGGLVVMDEDNCMVDVAKFFMDFIQRESCGKCIPCREGTKRMLEILKSITRSRSEEKGHQTLERFKGITILENLAEVIQDTSLCGLGKTAPNPVLTTLRWFKDEYESHIYDRKCPAGACVQLLTYNIDENACKGCTLCAKKCPTGAIKGAPKSPHYIVQEQCTGCGTCLDVCKFNAVTCS